MKILLGALTLLAATSTWANGCATDPSYGAGCGAGFGTGFGGVGSAFRYGTSVQVITGHDGQQFIQVAPSFEPHDEVRVIDYSGDYITEQVQPIERPGRYNGPLRFDLD